MAGSEKFVKSTPPSSYHLPPNLTDTTRQFKVQIVTNILKSAILEHIQKGGQPEEIAKRIMDELHASKLIAYNDPSKPSLLTVNGRVLYLLMENPDLSLREIAVRSGLTESSAQRAITTLVQGKLVKRRKVRGRNHYEIQREQVLDNPDFQRYHLSAEEFFNEAR